MTLHLDREVGRLKQLLLGLCAPVEESVREAVTAIQQRDLDRARKVIDADAQIDQGELDVEEECLKILALHQPVANDLRLIIAVLKINNDLERIGDLAVNVAEVAETLAVQPDTSLPIDLEPMAERVREMLRDSLDALVKSDPDLAAAVCAADDQVDAQHDQARQRIKAALRQEPQAADLLMELATVARFLERIADHATNIAEDVIYMLKGAIVRHGRRAAQRSG
jgi:phosphate transport system protein